MPGTDSLIVRVAVALGIGLLIGLERERRKGSGPSRAAAGIRTFALVSLTGALSLSLGGEAVLVAAALFVAALAALSYRRTAERDPGLTTEMALLATLLLGALAAREPALASGLGVVVAILLAVRERLHRFVRAALSEQEVHDALLFAAAALVVLPLTPDRPVGPFGVLNPRTLWRLVVLLLGIQGLGHIAVRAVGSRYGLALSGFASGFVSSAATIGAMGARARTKPETCGAAASGAVLSTVATFVQLAVVLAATSQAVLAACLWPLLFGGAAAGGYGAIFALRARKSPPEERVQSGRAFDLKTALLLAGTIAFVLFASAALTRWLGPAGLPVATALAGLADAHAPAISAASMAAAGRIAPPDAVLPILLALTTNTLTKVVVAVTAGGKGFALRIVPGLLLVLAALWAGLLVTGALP